MALIKRRTRIDVLSRAKNRERMRLPPTNTSNDNNDGAMMEQPTATEIYTALRIAREIGTLEAAQDLQRIRERKTTWMGALEHALRIEVDSFLRKVLG